MNDAGFKLNLGLRPHFDFWQTTRFELSFQRPLVMGIVNITPDSFSAVPAPQLASQAIQEAEQLMQDGADILDLGAESTRPGATPVTAEQEWVRLEPVLRELLTWKLPVSVDTYHAITMRRALDMGVDIINDVWALRQADALSVVAAYRCGICLMHMHGEPQTMQASPMQGDALDLVHDFFREQFQRTDAAGIAKQRLMFDPGIGFGKTVEQNFQLLALQDRFHDLPAPLMVGWSRKSSLGAVTGLGVHDRMVPSVAAAVLAVERGAAVVRVHDVAATVSALAVWSAARRL
ncbi:FolP Dihydropteroate synthase and related enzymes [Burkholderiaceae bacterium]|jgi:dihydropteroate synthase